MSDLPMFVEAAAALLPEEVRDALTAATGAEEDAHGEAWQRAVLALIALALDALPASRLRKLRCLRQGMKGASAQVGGIQEDQARVTAVLAGLMADRWGC